VKELSELIGGLVFWTIVLIVVFGINPWSKAVDWIQQLRGKPPIFAKPRLRPALETPSAPKRRTRVSTGKVYAATAIVDGNVVQQNVVAGSETAARNLAAERLRVEPDEVDVAEIVDKVIRR